MLYQANLTGANLSNSNLTCSNLSEAKIDLEFLKRSSNIIGVEVGVNGIYSTKTNSSALMSITPPGNSMQGSNADAIIECLKHARKLHSISLGFAGIAFLIAFLSPESIRLPLFSDFQTDPTHFSFLAIIFSIGILTLTESFMRAALDGAQYINDRDSVMKVGHFPWTLSKYDKGIWGKSQSFIMRMFLCFHPLVYLFLYFTILSDQNITMFYSIELLQDRIFGLLSPLKACSVCNIGNIVFGMVYFGLLVLSGRIFWLSQRFQKPILFDPITESKRKTDAAVLNEKVSELIKILKPN